MAYEFNDLKGFLFLVLLTIPLTTTTNINCNEKPFYCVNATHFMICVDLGNGVSSTIDDFVIPCPPTTVCHPNNRFECEFPHIEVTPPPLNVIGVSATDEKNVVSPLIDSVTTTAQIQETTSPPIEQYLPTLEEVISPKLIELFENFKEVYTNGNEPFFDVTTILPSNAESSNGISAKKFNNNNILTDSDTIYDSRSTTETTTLTDNNTEVLITDNSLAAETTTPVAELFDSTSKNNLEMNITTHQLGTENLQDGDNLHVTTTTFTPLIVTEQAFELNVNSDNMIPVNHPNYQRSFENNIASTNLKLSNASVVTINTISTTKRVPETTTNYVEPTTMPDNPQTTTIQDNLRLEGKYMLSTDAPDKSDDYIKKLSNQVLSEEKTSIHQDTIGAESITYEPLKVSNETIEVDSNNSFILLAPLEKQETPYNFVRDDSLPERVTEPSFLAKTDVTDFIMTTENTDVATNVELTTTPDNPQTTTIQDNLRPKEKYMLNTDAPGRSDDHIKILRNQTFGEENASVRQGEIGAELITYEPLEVTNKAVEVESNNSFIISAPLRKEETPSNSVHDDSLPEKVTELSFFAKPDVTDIIITTENTNKATNTATEALSTTDSIITVKIDINSKNSEDLEKKSITGTFLDDAKLYQDASKSNVTSNMKLDNARERIVNGTIDFDETTNNMVYTTVSAVEPSTGVTDEYESENITILNWQDKETTTLQNTVLNNDQYAGIASTTPMSYSTGYVYKTTPNPLDEKLSSTSSYGTTKDSSSNVLKLETVDNVLNISIPLLNKASGTLLSLEPINYTADILYEADAKSIIQTTIVNINNYESNSSTEPVDAHTPIDEVKFSSMHPTSIREKIDTTYKNSEDVTFIPQYTNTIDENNKKYYKEATNKVQNDFIISQAEKPTSPTYATEQGNIDLVRPENVPNLIIPTTESSSTDLIKQGDNKTIEIHTSIINNFVTTERSNTDINKIGNILFPSTLPINETHTKDIKDIILTSATAASLTESNQVSKNDTEYKRTMDVIEVDYTPSLTTVEPSNVKVTNVEDTKITYNCSSNMLLILPQEDKVLITQAKGNNTIITDQTDGTNNIKYATLTQIQNNTSEKNIEQNATPSLRTGEYIPEPNKNNENILATTLTPIIITSRSTLNKDENVVKLKEALSDPSTENPLLTGTEFINDINSLKTTTDEVLITTEAYEFYPKYDVTTKYSKMNEEENTATLKNNINLKIFSNIRTDNPISDPIITAETNMGNREPNPSSGYDTTLTSATTASSFAYTTESNQVSEHDTEYKRIMGPVDVDYTPSLTIVEPNNIKVTNVEDTKYSKMNEEEKPASLRNDMNLKVFSNIKTDNHTSDSIITTETYIDNREPNPSSGYKTKTQTIQSDETLTTPKVTVATIEKSIPIRITPAVVISTDKDSINNIISFNKQTSSIIDPNVNTNDPTSTITHSITKPTVIVETVVEPTLDDVILSEFMLANDTVNLNKNQLHLQSMSYSNITAHKEALHKNRLNMTFNSEKSANLSNREVMDLENGNNTLMATEINIEIDGNKNQNDISIEDQYESSTAYFEIPSRIEIKPNPPIHQQFKIFVNGVEHKPLMDAAGSAGFHLMQKGNESISSSSMIESKVKTTSGNESKYNYSSLNNRTYKVLITDKEQSNNSQASGNNKTNIGVSNSLSNITEQQSIINDKVVTSYVQTHIINNKTTNLVNNESNATISKTKDFSTSINLNCKPNINNTPSPFNCWNNTRGKYADSKDCRKFYICLGKLDPIIGSCPNNTVFSEINKQCTRNLSHCVRNNQFHCVYEGRFSDFIKDNTYYICVKYNMHFLRYKLQCEIGYHLNKATVKCEKNVESSSQSGSSVSENSQTKEKSENLDNKEGFDCKQEGKFPYSKDCRKYYVCSKNKKNEYRRKIKKCSDDKMYDIEKEKCLSAETNEC